MPFIDHFGLLAPFYERVIQFDAAEKISKIAELPVDGAMLDAGGGTGRVIHALAGQAGRRVVVDISFGMLQQARQKPGLQITQAATERLPFSDGYFDRILMIDALHHVEHYSLTAAEMWRVLKVGGRIVIGEPDIRTFAAKFVAVAEKLALMRSHFISPPVIARLFDYPNSRTEILRERWNAWVIVDKN